MINKRMIGKKVIVRSDLAGVFFGTLVEKEMDTVVLENARKLYYWDGACAVEQIALEGVKKPENCQFTVFVKEICIEGVCQTIPCTDESSKCIEGIKSWKA